MAEEQQDDVLELTDDMRAEQSGDTRAEEEPEQQEDGEFHIELEGEEAADETPLVRTLRDELRSTKRELAEHRKAQQPKIDPGPKPTLEGCDYDEDKYAADLLAWNDKTRQAGEAERHAEQQAQVRNEEFQKSLGRYRAKAAALPVKDFDDAEATIRATLPELIQSAIVTYADDPAKVVYALAKHPAKLAALAAEPDPVRAIIAVRDMERNLKVTTRKPPPPPMADNVQRGSAPMSFNADKKLAELEKKADATGDRSELIRYRQQMKK